jgi:spore maturation protein CgeB
MYYYRAKILEAFTDYDIKIWGPGFPAWLESPVRARFTGEYVAEVEKAKAFRAAKVVINTFTQNEVTGVNVRAFEAAGCGAFQVADWRPAVPDLFRPDEEIVLFRSRDELKEKVDYYLTRPDLRSKIAEAGCRRAHAEHTYRHRLERVLNVAEAC